MKARGALILIAVSQAALARQLIELARQIAPDVRLQLVRDGHGIVARVSKERPQLIILDTALEPVGGLEVLAALRKTPQGAGLAVVLVSAHPDAALVRAAMSYAPKALLTLPLNAVRMLKLLHENLVVDDPVPITLDLTSYLSLQRDALTELAGLQNVRRAIELCLSDAPQNKTVQRLCDNDWSLYERLRERAGQASGRTCSSLDAVLAELGAQQCLNIALELELERATLLADPRLGQKLAPVLEEVKKSAQLGAWLAPQVRLTPTYAYFAALLLNLGEFALAYSLQAWQNAGRSLSDGELKIAFELDAAGFGSALRIAWRLPIPLREAIAGYYGLNSGVLPREALLLNVVGQLLCLGDLSPSNLSEDRAVRMLGLGRQSLLAIPDELLVG